MRPLRCLLILWIVLLPAGPFATTFPVTKTGDTDDGTCDPDCSLREAIGAANTNPGADDVPVPAGTYLLTLGQLVVSDDVDIAGAGQASTIIDGNSTDRVFEIQTGVVEISGVTIQRGLERNTYPPSINYGGGGILNRGELALINTMVSSNLALYTVGGGISNWGGLTLTNSTVSGNTSGGSGGGIANRFGALALTNSTVSGNTVLDGVGGGIWGGDLTVTNSTVSGNTATHSGGGISNSAGYLENTIVADNYAPLGANCNSGLTSLGYNLTDDASCGFTEPTDLIVADAMLGPLQDNGGPTETHDLLPGSPAIDAGSVDCPPPDTDQRGVPRPQGADCDIGAVEYLPEPHHATTLIAGAAFLGLLYRRRVQESP